MSLRFKLLAMVFVGVALAGAGSAASLLYLQSSQRASLDRERRSAVLSFAMEMGREALLAEDMLMLSEHLRSAILRGEGLLAARWQIEREPWIVVEPAPEGAGLVLETASAGRLRIELGFSPETATAKSRAAFARSLRAALLVIAFVLVLGFPFAWAISSRFTRPLEDLAMAIDRTAEGQSHEPLPETRRDELGRLAARFNRMTEKLKQLDEMKDVFVRSVTHDIKSPLSAIESYARRLAESPAIPDSGKADLAHIETNAKRLREFVVQLLEEARIERGLLDIAPEKFDLAGMVRDTVVFFGPRARESEMRISFELPEASLPLNADPQRIQQVFANLVGNALKFTPKGGAITVYAKRVEAGFEAGIIDTGVGISAEDQKKLFKRFERIQNPLKAGGTGLGLSIVKGIIEAHGGSIGVESKPGTGSRFYFVLP